LRIDHALRLSKKGDWIVQVFEYMTDHHQVGTGANGLKVLAQHDPRGQGFTRNINHYLFTHSGVGKELSLIAAKINSNSKLRVTRLTDQTLHEGLP